MCRWMLYYGDPIMPSMLLFQTERGLILQSESCTFKKFEKGDCGPGRCRMMRAARSSNSRSGAVLISQ